MTGIRISTSRDDSIFAGPDITTSGCYKNETDNTAKKQKNQPSSNGNKCGHDPAQVKPFVVPPTHKKRPYQIIDLQKFIMRSHVDRKKSKYANLFRHLDATGGPGRLTRSEFAEVIAVLSCHGMQYYNVDTGELSWLDKSDGLWKPVKYETIAKHSGLSLSRVKRFFRFLQSRGWANVEIRSKTYEDGTIRALTARKTLNKSFFVEAIGVFAWEKIQQARENLLIKQGMRFVKAMKKNETPLEELRRLELSAPRNNGMMSMRDFHMAQIKSKLNNTS